MGDIMEKIELLNYVPKGRTNAISNKEIYKNIKIGIENPPHYSQVRKWLSELNSEGYIYSEKYDYFSEKEKEKYDKRNTLYYVPSPEDMKKVMNDISKPHGKKRNIGTSIFPRSEDNIEKFPKKVTA